MALRGKPKSSAARSRGFRRHQVRDWFGFLHAPVATLLAIATWMGLYWFEQAFVRAGQLPPLS